METGNEKGKGRIKVREGKGRRGEGNEEEERAEYREVREKGR